MVTKRNVLFNALTAYFLACTFFALNADTSFISIDFVGKINLVALAALTLILFGIFFTISMKRQLTGYPLLISAVCYGVVTVTRSGGGEAGLYYAVCVTAIIGALCYYLVKENLLPFSLVLSDRVLLIIIGVLAVATAGIVAYATILRYLGYNSSTFDFGIFAQMYENMAKTGIPLTTTERNVLMSHLSVHFSPIYYVLLPFYMLFRTPSFLLAAQAIIVVSGVIPVYLLCRHYRFGNNLNLAVCFVYLTYPAFSAACFYDFHENLFLPALLLWLLYFVERQKPLQMLIAALLLLLVKEDAGIYIASVGMFMLLYKRSYKWGGIVLGVGVIGFFATVSYISIAGGGQLSSYHYLNLIPPGTEGVKGIVQTAIVDPAYVVAQLLSKEKIIFLLQMLLPLAFMPLINKKVSSLILLSPVIIVNLMTTYSYQYNIDYQYIFGTGALLLFLFIHNLAQVPWQKVRRVVILTACVASLTIMLSANVSKLQFYIPAYQNSQQEIALTDAALETIPEDASIVASTFIVPKLYAHEEVYMYPMEGFQPQYVVMDVRPGYFPESDTALAAYTEQGYETVLTQGYVMILEQKE